MGEPTLTTGWIIWSPLLYSNFKSLKDPNSSSFSSTFVRFLKFPQIKKEGCNFLGETEWLNYLVPCSLYQLLKFKEPNSLSFIRFQFIQQYFSQIWGAYSGKRLNRLVSPLSVFQFWKFIGPKFFVIHSISMYCKWFSSTFLRFIKFLQIRDGGHNFLEGKQFFRMAELVSRPFFTLY